MSDPVAAVMAAADLLKTAIAEARAAGYRVDSPDAALAGIAVSATSRAIAPAPEATPDGVGDA